jgi:hypothetical protein
MRGDSTRHSGRPPDARRHRRRHEHLLRRFPGDVGELLERGDDAAAFERGVRVARLERALDGDRDREELEPALPNENIVVHRGHDAHRVSGAGETSAEGEIGLDVSPASWGDEGDTQRR